MIAPPKLPVDRARAQACLWSNLAIPGSGSWLAGWRVSGALQLTLAVGGLLLSIGWGVWFLAEWAKVGKLPILVIYDNDGQLPPGYLKFLLIGLGGLGLFGLALGWAFLTSLLIVQAAKRDETR
ncbi:MAG: hypothetical protein RL514_1037 [Verrucomicrobiota bacterium]|jgi:hypothetical protein